MLVPCVICRFYTVVCSTLRLQCHMLWREGFTAEVDNPLSGRRLIVLLVFTYFHLIWISMLSILSLLAFYLHVQIIIGPT